MDIFANRAIVIFVSMFLTKLLYNEHLFKKKV